MKIGIFGGSFDPVHNGHVELARYAREHAGLDEVWLMVSPRNPLKPQGPVATDEERLKMALLATEGIAGVEVSDFEFSLPVPSYTYLTLEKLSESYPEHTFRLIIGEDNWENFDKWRNPDEIIRRFHPIVYPRGEERDGKKTCDDRITFLPEAPLMEVSSTEVRDRIKKGESVEELLDQRVQEFISQKNLYK